MKRLLGVVLSLLAVVLMSSQSVSASSIYATGSTGVDVSYPNCQTLLPKVDFGVVGVTGGLVYSHNACAATEAGHFQNLSMYINTGLNNTASSSYYASAQVGCNGSVSCAAYNYGYNAAQDAISYASSQGLSSSKWWLDVETSNTWSNDPAQNQQSLVGARAALISAGATTVGVYSTTAQWKSVTGGWQNNWPNWGATTWTTAKQAQSYCTGHQFTGGPSLLMQFKSKQSKVDQDVAC